MKTLFALLLTTVAAFAQFGGESIRPWEPRDIRTKAGLVASYDPSNLSTMVFNPSYAPGNGVSALSNRVTVGTADLLQGTAANQPKISRTDNAGNLLKQSEDFSTTWTLTRINPFNNSGSNLDTGATGEGSHYNTSRTLDPLGGNTADFIQEDGTAASSHFIRSASIGIGGLSVTYSLFAKQDVSGLLTNIMLYDSIADKGKGFNLALGTAVAVSGITAPTSSSIITDPSWNGFYLCSITYTAGATASGLIYCVTNNAGTYQITYSGDNTKGVFIWGASLVPTSWTPVTGATAALGYVATTTVPIFPGLGGRSVLYCDGSAYRMQTAGFTLNQPNYWIVLANPWTWTLNDAMMDGVNNNSGKIYQADTSPKIRASAGTASAEFTPPPAGTWRVLNVVFDGANSRMSTNGGAWTVSDAGTSAMGGFTLGSAGTAGTTYWNGLIGLVLGFSKTNDVAEMNYLSWGLKKQAGVY